ncbi:MAG: aconitate hydratase [Deltaproteobacteria bacterium]|jgi:aconitate hydratase|nr:aconitate hydratase [Deltaproteobacteria bacterium]
MPRTLTEKIIASHLAAGEMKPGAEIGIRIDQTLVHDATGQMAVLQFEALGKPRVTARRSVVYCDHNILQVTSHNADDHAFLRTAAARFGMVFSKVGNGICHQLNLERFGVPGETLLGADSHTTTGGALGALAIGAGGLDVAAAMGGRPFFLNMPRIMRISLTGALGPWATAKDAALEVLRRLTVSGGRGHVLEFAGEGLRGLSLTQRAVIANMSIETGAVTAVFPSDAATRAFLALQGRAGDWRELAADPGAGYSSEISIDLGALEPLAAAPHSPDNVRPVSELAGTRCDQVAIGSCTNSSFQDLMTAAAILKGRTVPPHVSLIVAPGSRQVYWELARRGALSDLIASGARVMEAACGFCNGVGQAPPSGGVSLRTSNRNFPGRSGTPSAGIYLVSPETAAASAIAGELADPRRLGDPPRVELPGSFRADDSMFVPPASEGEAGGVEIVRGPSIAPLPRFGPPPDSVEAPVMLALGDNVTTDDILPAGAHILALRANIPAISRYIFSNIEPDYHLRQKEAGAGFVIGGANYGQGSSREHAALAPRYLGLTGVIAESFARIHQANLCNFGLLPLVFLNPGDRGWILQGHTLRIEGLLSRLRAGGHFAILDETAGREFEVRVDASARQVEMLLAGGLLALAAASGD